jgi:hypothetical protein
MEVHLGRMELEMQREKMQDFLLEGVWECSCLLEEIRQDDGEM